MSNYRQFFENLTSAHPAVSTDRKDTYGYIWEAQVCIWFLKNDPIWKTKFKPETIMSPQDWGYGIISSTTGNVVTQDIGIDIVAEDYDGKLWGIQAKCYTDQIPTTEIQSFITALGLTWTNVTDPSRTKDMDKGLLLITNEISRTMRSQLQNLKKEVVEVGPEYFDTPESELDWFESINKAPKSTYTVKTPYPHQAEALENIENGWQDNNRGKCIMACGTGKTMVGLWTAEALQSKTTLVLLPSLALVNQIATEWLKEAKIPISPLFVCSDPTVTKNTDEYIINAADLGFPVTTDENEIVSFFQKAPAEHRVIFSTYQSSESIEKAQKLGAPNFDVVIADEAHHCAGKIDKDFARVLDAEKIRSDKRLFMTATPKYVTKRLRKESENYDVETASMDDEDQFGPSFYTLNFGEAISKELLSDYQVVVNIITEKDAENMIKKRTLVSVGELQSDPQLESDAESVAMMTSLIQVIEEKDLSHIITFHNKIVQAKQLSKGLNVLFPQIHENYENNPPSINHISGKMTTKERAGLLKQFREAEGGINILSNAKCLTEGVDVRAIDGIAFFEPKKSQIDIVQAVGRAIRKNKEDKEGTIFIPIYIPENEINDPELVIQNSRFKDVWNILQALRDHDQQLADELDSLRMELGQRGNFSGGVPSKIRFTMPTRIDAAFFRDKVETLLVMETTASWEAYYGAFIAYKEEHGDVPIPRKAKSHDLNLGQWVGTQRSDYKKGKLLAERIKRLEEAGIVWDAQEEMWQAGYQAFIAYKEEHGDVPIPNKARYHDYNLGGWVFTQRGDYTRGTLSDERIKKLRDAGIIWDVSEEQWQEGYRAFIAYTKENPDVPIETKTKYHDYNLGNWVNNQRHAYQRKINPKIKKINTLGAAIQTLSDERVKELDSIGFIWSVRDRTIFTWDEAFDALKKYREEFGHLYIPQTYKNDQGFRLGLWQTTTQRPQTIETMSQERKDQLNSVGFIWENRNKQTFDLLLLQIKTFKEEFGHTLIPVNYISDDFDPFSSPPYGKKNTQYKLGKKLQRLRDYKENSKLTITQEQLLELKQLGVDLDKTPPDFPNRYHANMNFLQSIKDDFLFPSNTNLLSERLVQERVDGLFQNLYDYNQTEMENAQWKKHNAEPFDNNKRQITIVKKRYGLDDLYIKTLQELGDEFGITRERIRQIVAKTFKKF